MASYAMLMVSHYGALLFLGSGLAFGYYMLFIRDPSCFRHQVDTNFTHRVIICVFFQPLPIGNDLLYLLVIRNFYKSDEKRLKKNANASCK